ncbi:MAG TPA: hypothetical protein VFX39_07330 [Gemmatimonadaceae bacterium]|nr:hypothetical protein [Gemmatimonadaceae bacterium]
MRTHPARACTMAAGLALALALAPRVARAQAATVAVRSSPSYELRADLLAARETTVHAGGAVLWPVGRAVRLGVQVGAGITGVDAPPDGDDSVASGRVELVARFELDPYAERRWGLYGAAGGGVLAARGRTGRGIIFAAVGVERRSSSRFVPALELGLGGGARVGVVVRRR